MGQTTMDTSTLIWIFGVILTLAQAGFLFLWNNLRSDIKELKDEIEKKADTRDVDQRRNDIKQLFEDLANTERALTRQVSELKTEVLVKLEGMKANAPSTNRRRGTN